MKISSVEGSGKWGELTDLGLGKGGELQFDRTLGMQSHP